jgi:hypothetical protein
MKGGKEMHPVRLLSIVLLIVTLVLTLTVTAQAASTGGGGGGGDLHRSEGAIMNANRTQTFSMTGATYWDNALKKFIVSPDYYHYWSDENWKEKSRTTGKYIKIDGFELSWATYGVYMNATLKRDDSTNFIWGDPHWNINGVHVYEIPQKTSYWYDMGSYSVRFICNYMVRWNLSVITEIQVYCPGKVRYRIDMSNNIIKYNVD